MGHYSYFCGCASREAASAGDGEGPLLEAKYYVPLFWLAAFDAEDLVVGAGEDLALLCAPTATGLERLRRRRHALLGLVGERFGALYDEWLAHVAARYPRMLLLNVRDLFSMTDFAGAAARLRENLAALALADEADNDHPLTETDALQRFAYIEGVTEPAPRESIAEAALRSRAVFAGWAYGEPPWPLPPTREELAWLRSRVPQDFTAAPWSEVFAHLEDLLSQQVPRAWAEAVSPLALHILASRGDTALVQRITKHLGEQPRAAVLAWLAPEPLAPGERRPLPYGCQRERVFLGGPEDEAEALAAGYLAGRAGDAAVDALLPELNPECHALVLVGATVGRGSPAAAWQEPLAAITEADIAERAEDLSLSPLGRAALLLGRAMASDGARAAMDALVDESLRAAHAAAAAYVAQVERRLGEPTRDEEQVQSVLAALDEHLAQARSGALTAPEGLRRLAWLACRLSDADGATEAARVVAAFEQLWGPMGEQVSPTSAAETDRAVLDILTSARSRAAEALDSAAMRSAVARIRARLVPALMRDDAVEKLWQPLGELLNRAELDEQLLLPLVPVVALDPQAPPRIRAALAEELARLAPASQPEPIIG